MNEKPELSEFPDDPPDPPDQQSEEIPLAPFSGCVITFGAFFMWLIGLGIVEIIQSIRIEDSEIGIEDYQIGIGTGMIEFVYTLLFALAFWFVLKSPDSFKMVGLKWNWTVIPQWLVGMIFGMAGVGGALLLIYLGGDVSIAGGKPPLEDSAMGGSFTWPIAIFMFIFYAGNEEILARGMLYPAIKRSVGLIWAVLLSSLAFTALHVMNDNFSVLPFIDIFLAGVLLAMMRELTGNIWLAWGVHFGWNFAIVGAGLPVSGMIAYLEPQRWHLVTSGHVWITGGGFGPEGGLGGILANVAMIGVVYYLLLRKERMAQDPLEQQIP